MIRAALQHLALLWVLVFLGVLAPGCGPGLPDDVRQAASGLEKSLDTADTQIRSQQEKFNKIGSEKAFAGLAAYAAREDWAGDFDRAHQTLARARSLYGSELAPLLKDDKPEAAPRVKVQIQRIESAVQEARTLARNPFDRMGLIRAAMDDAPGVYDRARRDGDTLLSQAGRLEKGPVAEAVAKFPGTAEKIRNRFAPLAAAAATARAAMTTLEYQFQAPDGKRDLAAFADAAQSLARGRERMKQEAADLETDLGRLYQSYTKVLQDMKVDYYLTIRRESWDENSDYDNARTATFTRQVSPATYEALADTEVESIATVAPAFGFGNLSFKNNIGSAWEGLGITPTENWPDRRHNAATFWIEETREDYFHKYLQETNGETKETGWEKVNPSFYEQHLENLGMAILSKPYGEFEPDPVAAPPGMAYVGNPEYGEWKKDDSGNSFWSWYGRYAFFSSLFFFPPSYYYYGPWDRWRTGYRYQKPYYGKTASGQNTYGTRGTQVRQSPRYQGTTFAKTGGLKSAPASVRGGGSSLRGGGPKGKGK